jgi:hypothetical protein
MGEIVVPVLKHIMKVCVGVEVKLCTLLTSPLDGSELISFMFQLVYPQYMQFTCIEILSYE